MKPCSHCSKVAIITIENEDLCKNHLHSLKTAEFIDCQVTQVPKTKREEILKKKYMKFINRNTFFTKRQLTLAINSIKKEIVALSVIFFLVSNFSFAQEGIISGYASNGNSSFVIGGNIIDTPILFENKFTKPKPVPIPKPRPSRKGMKYKKSEAQKIKEALRKLTIKK